MYEGKKISDLILEYPGYFKIIVIILILLIKNSFTYNTGVSLEKNNSNVPGLKKEKKTFPKNTLIDSAVINSLKFNGKYDSLYRKTGYWIELDKKIDSTIKGIKVHFGKTRIDTMGTRQFIILTEGIYKNGEKNGIWFVYIQHSIQESKWVKTFDIIYSQGDTIKIKDFRNPLIMPWEAKPSFTYPSMHPFFVYEREKYFEKLNSEKKY